MDIGDVTLRTGLTNATLHHYEQLGLIASTGRAGLRRQYDDSVIETLAVVVLCRRSGFTLAEIGGLLAGNDHDSWKPLAISKLAQLEDRINDLTTARDGLKHALSCPSPNIMRCDHFQATLRAVLPT
jgi:DNA-binding transcriptional MerR regulator